MNESDSDLLFDTPSASTARLLITGLNAPCSREDEHCDGHKAASVKDVGPTDDNISVQQAEYSQSTMAVELSMPFNPIETFEIFEPERHLAFPAPAPKLHYTTKWRKLTRRLYQTRY